MFTVLHGGREVSDALRHELADELEERAARSRAVDLDELCRLAAQDLLAVALEAERRAYLEAHADQQVLEVELESQSLTAIVRVNPETRALEQATQCE
jgi:hypothetical protein